MAETRLDYMIERLDSLNNKVDAVIADAVQQKMAITRVEQKVDTHNGYAKDLKEEVKSFEGRLNMLPCMDHIETLATLNQWKTSREKEIHDCRTLKTKLKIVLIGAMVGGMVTLVITVIIDHFMNGI